MHSPIVSAVLVLAIIIAIVGGFAIVIEQNNAQMISVDDTILKIENRLLSLEDKLALILEDNEELTNKLADREEQQKIFEEEQTTLFADVNEQFSAIADEDATAIVERWGPFVYEIRCEFEEKEETSGSAIVERSKQEIKFITNQHLIEKEGFQILSCTLTKPKSGEDFVTTISIEGITVEEDEDVDIAYGPVTETIPAFDKAKRCSSVPAIGDKVVILGYPGIGATDSITATEGIVSGFDDEYYITSAKIEKGNSGSAAIHVKNDCMLGLPTRVVPGKLESFARILPLTQ